MKIERKYLVKAMPRLFIRVINKTKLKGRINYDKLAISYQHIIDAGIVKNRAEIARHLGKSRTWITKVFQRGGPN